MSLENLNLATFGGGGGGGGLHSVVLNSINMQWVAFN